MSAADALVDCQAENAAMRKRITKLERLNAVALDALDNIAHPIASMRRNLKEGQVLNGQMALALATDANYLQSIANNAITELNKEKKKRA